MIESKKQRRQFTISAIVFALLSTATFVSTSLAAGPQSRPNILLIFTDDQGMNDVGCYGSKIPTPHIDSLARDGVRFTNWYAASSICTPSRFGLLTGRFPSRSQDQLLGALMFLSEEHADTGIQSGETTVASVLAESGYDTALVGKWHLGHGSEKYWPTKHGFGQFFGHTGGCVDYFTMRYGIKPDWYRNREVLDLTGYATDVISDEAVRYLSARDNERPFFLMLAYNAPHFGKGHNYATGDAVNIMQPRAVDLPRVKGIDDVTRRQFAAMTMRLDDGVGHVLATLDRQKLRENTLVIFMTDHGGDPKYGGANEPYRGQKATLFEGGIRVPCIMRWPARFPKNKTIDGVAGAVDFFPTFCELAGASTKGQTLDGQSFLPVVQDEAKPEREMLWELGAHTELKRKPWFALRKGDWKYLSTPNDGEMLFDLKNDPYEKNNLARQFPDRLEQLKKRTKTLVKEVRTNAK